MTATLPELVADALFQAVVAIEDDKGVLGMEDCTGLATTALQAVRAQGWRIVKLAPVPDPTTPNPCVVAEEWTG